jgi:hypothetical protein
MFPDVMLRFMLLQECLWYFKQNKLWLMQEFNVWFELVDDFPAEILWPVDLTKAKDQKHLAPFKLDKLLRKNRQVP